MHGVGDVQLFGSSYAMRIWLDPDKLAGFGLSASEVFAAVQEQNSQTAGGGLGDQPNADHSEFTAQIVTQSRFSTPEQFREIIVHANPDGSTVRLGDVARVELGNDSYGNRLTVNGKEAAGIAIQLASGANALAVANNVRQRMTELQPIFPRGVTWAVPFDTTPFITTSVHGVVRTMIEALLLVTVVVFLFLQDWRATLIPTLVVPVALVGTCAGLYLFGLSINILSLFGMVVAIGILNDDAIVVVENVERIMRDEGLSAPRGHRQGDRADLRRGDREHAGAGRGVHSDGLLPRLDRRHLPAILGHAGGVDSAVSRLLALTLGAALCAALLRNDTTDGAAPRSRRREAARTGSSTASTRGSTPAPTATFAASTRCSRAPLRWLLVFVVACVVTGYLFARLPGGFLPTEDQGHLFITYTGAPGSTEQRTQQAIRQVEAFLAQQPQVRNVASVTGFSFFGQGQSAALSFVDLKPWDERPGEANSASALVRRANGAFRQIPEAVIFALDPPAIPSLGNATGFTMKIQDRSGVGGDALQQAARRVMIEASQSDILAGVRSEGMPEAPQLYVEIDRVKARALGLQIGQVNQALALSFGANYVNDFVFEGNVLRVILQADAEHRMRAEDVSALRLRNNRNEMVPFSAFSRVRWISGPQQLERYNGFPSATLSGQAAAGRSSGAAIAEMERIASHVLTGHFTYEWTGTAFEEKQAGGQIGLLLGLSLVVVFLLLAALYESWAIPAAVLLIIPFGVIGAVVLTMLRGLSADVYFNIGLVTIIGLAAKNAILIVEFAIKEESEGSDAMTAAKNGAQQRLRPILMTSVTFVLGMMPLVLATGAGAASRRAVGTGVMGSMLTATLFGVFFTPLFYVAARRWLSRKKRKSDLDEFDEPGNGEPGGGRQDA